MKIVLYGVTFLMGTACGHYWRTTTAALELAHYQQHATEQIVYAQYHARQREQRLATQFQTIQENAQIQFETLLDNERTAAEHRVQQLVKTYAAGNRSAAPATITPGCKTERNRASVLAELLTELDALAEQFAATADRNRIAGLTCEAAYTRILEENNS